MGYIEEFAQHDINAKKAAAFDNLKNQYEQQQITQSAHLLGLHDGLAAAAQTHYNPGLGYTIPAGTNITNEEVSTMQTQLGRMPTAKDIEELRRYRQLQDKHVIPADGLAAQLPIKDNR